MYAIVRIGGRQYHAEVGQAIVTEKLPYEVGESLDFDDVLLVKEENGIKVGQPTVSGAVVKAQVVQQFKGKKIIVFKYKSKNRYRRKQGHRQRYTRLMVNEIVPGS